MTKIILIDWNGIAIGNIVSQKMDADENLIRHMILNTVRMYRKRFHREYGEVVICCDGGKNWRKEYFPQYKFKRKQDREESSTDWNRIFEILHMVLDEIKENFPYKVVHVQECEADDIIATLAYDTQEFGNYEQVLIVSSDKDFLQLQSLSNVKQFSPLKKKIITELNPKQRLLEHILRGDAGDGVPNVLSDDNCFVEGRRQSPVTSKFIYKVIDTEKNCFNQDNLRNFNRNETLIDLTKTPDLVKQKIINNYYSQSKEENRSKVLPFLISKRCKLLIECVEEFI